MCESVCHHSPASPRSPYHSDSARAPEPAYRVESIVKPDGTEEVVSVESTSQTIRSDEVILRDLPYGLAETETPSPETFREKYVAESALTPELKERHDRERQLDAPEWEGSEVKTIVNQGPSANRIDLTIVGDGYTEEEKQRFFTDAKRLTDEMFVGQTFASYLPLFNVHAVFVPSEDSGLTDTERKDTALGLYRSPSGSKRGVMPGNRFAIERAIKLAPDADYPILVANDDFYGGLGGRYAITTRSENSGTMVLRHELGHNFGNVGEEYDGGQVYRGANHSRSSELPWKQWMNEQAQIQSARSLATDYPWQNLSQGPLNVDFKVPESDAKEPMQVGIDISSVGWEADTDVEILIDGKPQKYQGIFTEDRSFFRLEQARTLTAGNHRLTIREKNPDGNNVVAAVKVTGYPADYDFTPDKVAGYPTFNSSGSHVGYRPTHESCLMRNMRETKFCSVDQENMWHQFLNRVDLIDSVDVTAVEGKPEAREVEVKTPALDGLDIRWYRSFVNSDGKPEEAEVEGLRGQNRWTADRSQDAGDYRVEVRFATDEVRRYSERFRTEERFKV